MNCCVKRKAIYCGTRPTYISFQRQSQDNDEHNKIVDKDIVRTKETCTKHDNTLAIMTKETIAANMIGNQGDTLADIHKACGPHWGRHLY